LQFHFDSEELMMKTYNYPYISEQKMQHELMRRNTFRLIEEVKQNRTILIQLLFNLEKWFIEHDNDFDKEFGKYVLRIRNSL
jgi:hemerythrin-like metal-binding protein